METKKDLPKNKEKNIFNYTGQTPSSKQNIRIVIRRDRVKERQRHTYD